MAHRLLDRLERRTTLVVGKGGVGKSTVATALALALADSGEPAHLVSTDPAHSIADILDEPAPPGPWRSACSDRLTAEELDAEGIAMARMGDLAPALRDLIDRGTYLDRDDASSLLHAAVPGLDEIGAALRIAELARAGRRLVVDTAPTGHTLRLLDTPATLGGWLRVFAAMAAKADVVATALVGRPVPAAAEDRLEALRDDMDRFAAAIRAADFLVVTAEGAVVEAETRRLLDALARRRLRVAATAAAARPGASADILLPVHQGLIGCAALRTWWQDADRDAAAAPPAGAPPGAAAGSATGVSEAGAPVLPPELDREMLLFVGKGGVGKTTSAAAAAVVAAAAGPVALLGVDPAGSLRDVLPDPPPGVGLRELDAAAELERLKGHYREEVETVFRAVGLDRSARLDRDVVESLWDLAPPGLDELMAVGRLSEEVPAGTRLVLDTAPTGHFLRLIAMPDLALDWTHRLMRILLKYRALGSLDAPADRLLRFAKQLRGLRSRLADPTRTAIVLVTLDEPVARAETRRLAGRLDALGLAPAAVLVNRATAAAAPDLPLPAFRAPVELEPVGADRLRRLAGRWERIR